MTSRLAPPLSNAVAWLWRLSLARHRRHYIDGLTMSGTTGPMGFWTTIPDLLEIA